ncbi:hypothetical protein BKK79_25295 [Cupriavidus sp. USMAA2-4]|uniref:Uncharacterized protein n=1 Tax=Cupriavidus malaysiensis TaxID=367825 RepID=A0ABN4TV93_9BURK|nr:MULTISPECIES: hypothetical protein [Cupriavidus]AOY95122.1 hypothetical protein BKK79_25295 [Cupriavidus sp. USMAA2-4]AOZ08284.1 hypothetical protein BKK80_20065 [Cupriavidus malaysiensis]
MSAGEVQQPAIGPSSESANLSIHPVWAAPREPGSRGAFDAAGEGQDVDLGEILTRDALPSDGVRQTLDALRQRNRLLEAELMRLRALLQEWMLSQLTYKALYFQYSGQRPEAPHAGLMQEKEMVRRHIREQWFAGSEHQAVPGDQTCRMSKP